MTAPACARAVGSRRDLVRLATVVTASTTPMATSDTAVVISGTRGLSPWPQCRISFTPMNPKMSARPLGQVHQAVEQAGHQEEQRPQAQQGEGVGGEDDVGLIGDAEEREGRRAPGESLLHEECGPGDTAADVAGHTNDAAPPSHGRRGRPQGPGGRVETGKEMFRSQLTRSARSVVEAPGLAEPASTSARGRGRGAPMGRQRASEACIFSCWRYRRALIARRRAVSAHPERARTGPRSVVIAITSLW
jgi:hypothetical protein